MTSLSDRKSLLRLGSSVLSAPSIGWNSQVESDFGKMIAINAIIWNPGLAA
jgi:hypothetical protein